jgi:hypothetical protein
MNRRMTLSMMALTVAIIVSVALYGRASAAPDLATTASCTAALLDRSCLTTAQRYTALAEAYAARRLRGFRATGARYTGLAAAYTEAQTSRERAARAETARLEGLVAEYTVRRYRGLMVSGMRYTALAASHASVERAHAAYAARNQGLADHYVGYAAVP